MSDTAPAIIATAIRAAVRAEARELRPGRQDQIADAAIQAVAPFLDALRAGSSRGFNRAAAKQAAPVRTESAALLSPTTTAGEAGIAGENR